VRGGAGSARHTPFGIKLRQPLALATQLEGLSDRPALDVALDQHPLARGVADDDRAAVPAHPERGQDLPARPAHGVPLMASAHATSSIASRSAWARIASVVGFDGSTAIR
jgi:hypothetical protein